MLEIRHVTKKYETKGVTVTALNDVSVTFPEKGMIFLVGKSGSGKSTLLNISGGLDSPDEGEIILKGKSSKSFTEADFDSYRNTFIGFIFQEFNVLSEYTVEENISLALELQGKPADREKVEELLKKVDLEGYGKRKPNTLSGGQKQRVAIARALVKNPEIIMADEPTGALDSATGKQVLDTLKKLSEEKLVVVVSHDMDFANRYADRIIELKDGKIISDRVKGEAPKKRRAAKSEGNTLYIVPDEVLSDEDMEEVKNFYSSEGKDKKISLKHEDDGEAFISPSVAADNKRYNGDDVKFIKSRLPAKHAIRMGSSSLKVKPIRLIFTILLSTVAFIIFGMFTTLVTFSKANIIAEEAVENNFQGAVIERSVTVEQHYYAGAEEGDVADESRTYIYDMLFSDDDVSSLVDKYGLNTVGIYNYGHGGDGYFTLKNNLRNSNTYNLSLYYSKTTSVLGFCDMENKDLSSYGLTLVAGRYPTGENEIAITTYQYEMFKKGGFMPVTEQQSTKHYALPVASYENVLGCWVSLANIERVLTIGGTGGGSETMDDSFTGQIVGVIDCGEIPDKYSPLEYVMTDNKVKLNREPVLGLSGTEIFNLVSDFEDYYSNSFHGVYFVGDAFYEANISEADYDDFPTYDTIGSLATIYSKRESGLGSNEEEAVEAAIARCVKTRDEYKKLISSDDSAVGHYFVTDFDYVNYDASGAKYDYVFFSISSGTTSAVERLVSLSETTVNDVDYSLNYSFMYEANVTEDTVNSIMSIFLAAGVGLALFAALMLSNFISASINGKEKDIGILRAIGARGTDIFKIFITEALIVTLACFFISAAATIGVCSIVNGYLIKAELISLKMFLFIFPDALMMLAVAIVSAFVATVFPVVRTVKKKPVEAIRSL